MLWVGHTTLSPSFCLHRGVRWFYHRPVARGNKRFELRSQGAGDDAWTTHCEGKVESSGGGARAAEEVNPQRLGGSQTRTGGGPRGPPFRTAKVGFFGVS
jgi:hypothetical protein